MTNIRIFNPEHDIALASNLEHFTAPHAGRQLRNDISFLPALWADDGDIILVDDIDAAESAYRKIKKEGKATVEFCTLRQIPSILKQCGGAENFVIDSWGWDLSLRHQFIYAGYPEDKLPSKEAIAQLRVLSGRQITTSLLRNLREGLEHQTVGESLFVSDMQTFERVTGNCNAVVKAPWSSSGRGVKYFTQPETPLSPKGEIQRESSLRWVSNIIAQQGGVMVEPLYNKIRDFGMEFEWHRDGALSPKGEILQSGTIEYKGLSLFSTVNGAYTGNILATENEKRQMMSRYIPLSLLDEMTKRLCHQLSEVFQPLSAHFVNIPFGVDMMVVANGEGEKGFLLHPCVEINLRRTMGHVALALSPEREEMQRQMNVVYENAKYKVRLDFRH